MNEDNTKKQNVLIVHNYYQTPGGEDAVVENEKNMLKEKGHKVVLYTRNNNELNQMTKRQKLLLPLTTIFNIETYKDIKLLIKKEEIDIVHVHNTLNLISPAVYYAAKKMKVPVIQTVHNFRLLCPAATFYRNGSICEDCVKYGLSYAVKYNCYRHNKILTMACTITMWIHRILGIYGKINYICLTDFNKNKLLKLKQIKSDQVFIKPNFVDNCSAFIPEENRKEQFIYAGRLDKLKGIDILFKTWKYMGNKAPKLIVCGIGPMEKWCKEFVKINNVNIEMRGFVANSDVHTMIANSKGLILPTQWYEGFPMSIIEAFSVGTPVLCSDLGNAGNLISNGITGYKFNNKNIKEIADAVQKCSGMSKSTLETYQKMYKKDINYQQLIEIYEMARK